MFWFIGLEAVQEVIDIINKCERLTSEHTLLNLNLAFNYGFKNEIATGIKASIETPEQIKNFALTPANKATTIPPAAIRIEVPRSGCVATKMIGPIRTVIGRTKCLKELIFSIEIR